MDEEEIVGFVRETLGCGCPDEVFRTLSAGEFLPLGPGQPSCRKIDVGHRLLIYLLAGDDPGFDRTLFTTCVRAGLRERDGRGYNRFRMAVFSGNPVSCESRARSWWNDCPAMDDKAHLHVVPATAVPEI